MNFSKFIFFSNIITNTVMGKFKTNRVAKKTIRKKKASKAWYQQKYSVGDMAKAALKGVNYIKTLINVEKHIHIKGAAGDALSTGVIIPLIDVAQGDQNGQRTGLSVLCRSLTLRLHLRQNSNNPISMVRYMIIQDTQQVADTNPQVSDVLTSDWMSGLNVNTVGRFRILKSQFINLSSAAQPQYFIDDFFDLSNIHIRYNGTLGTDYQSNGFYLVLLGNNSTFPPQYAYNSRFHFYDN